MGTPFCKDIRGRHFTTERVLSNVGVFFAESLYGCDSGIVSERNSIWDTPVRTSTNCQAIVVEQP